MILICLLSSWQLQCEEKEIQSWPLRFASGVVDLLQNQREEGRPDNEENLVLQPCAKTLLFPPSSGTICCSVVTHQIL